MARRTASPTGGAPPPSARERRTAHKVEDPRRRIRDRRRFHWSETWIARAAVALIPLFYEAYVGFVNLTSRHAEIRMQELWSRLDEGRGALVAVLHEDVFFAPEMAREKGCVTMASYAGVGSAISSILERAGFLTFRGSPVYSSRDRGGRRAALGILRYLRAAPSGPLVGITVDGSRGPAGEVKSGVILMAKSTGFPVYVHKTYARRHLRAPTWDRSYLPLPFNHILQVLDGPFALPVPADEADVERLRAEVEAALARTAADARGFFEA